MKAQTHHRFPILTLLLAVACTQSTSPKISQEVAATEAATSDQRTIALGDLLPEVLSGDSRFSAQEVSTGTDENGQRTKTYQAISLEAVLQEEMGASFGRISTSTITFVCKDGYEPAHRVREMPLSAGWLAFRDHDAPEGERWPAERAENYTPFFLVWDVPANESKHLSWPYGLVRLEVSFEDPHASIAPKGDGQALGGFRLYEQRCIKCHTINKIGGQVGPELNYPRSITEYLEKEIIWQYTKDPKSFRYNSRMHGTSDITREEFELIYAYLVYMKGRSPDA